MFNIPKMGQLPTPDWLSSSLLFFWAPMVRSEMVWGAHSRPVLVSADSFQWDGGVFPFNWRVEISALVYNRFNDVASYRYISIDIIFAAMSQFSRCQVVSDTSDLAPRGSLRCSKMFQGSEVPDPFLICFLDHLHQHVSMVIGTGQAHPQGHLVTGHHHGTTATSPRCRWGSGNQSKHQVS
jgi:hypothetical protein